MLPVVAHEAAAVDLLDVEVAALPDFGGRLVGPLQENLGSTVGQRVVQTRVDDEHHQHPSGGPVVSAAHPRSAR